MSKYFHRSAVAQLTNEGIECLSKIRKFCDGTMVITKQDARNLLDGLNALGEDDYGIDWMEKNSLDSKEVWDNNPLCILKTEKMNQIRDLKIRLVDYIDSFNKKDE